MTTNLQEFGMNVTATVALGNLAIGDCYVKENVLYQVVGNAEVATPPAGKLYAARVSDGALFTPDQGEYGVPVSVEAKVVKPA